ncbi:hypothetical protein Hanom_Chr14g01262391 [Helianthus anomalus]
MGVFVVCVVFWGGVGSSSGSTFRFLRLITLTWAFGFGSVLLGKAPCGLSKKFWASWLTSFSMFCMLVRWFLSRPLFVGTSPHTFCRIWKKDE